MLGSGGKTESSRMLGQDIAGVP